MSLVDQKFRPELIKTYPKAMEDLKPRFNVKGSSESYNLFSVDPESNNRNSTLFTIRPSSFDTLVRRDLRVTGDLIYPVSVIVAPNTPANTPLISPSNFAFRDRPLNRMFSEPSLSVNGHKITMQMEEVFQSLNMLTFDDNVSNSFMSPNNLDLTYLNYNDATGSQSTPLSSLSNSSLQTQHIPDGAFAVSYTDPNGNDLQGTGTYAQDDGDDVNYVDGIPVAPTADANPQRRDLFVKIRVNEHLMISPLLFHGNGLDTESFWGIKDLTLRLNYQSEPRLIRNASNAPNRSFQILEDQWRGNMTSWFKTVQLYYYQLDVPAEINLPSLNSLPIVSHEVRRANALGNPSTVPRGGSIWLKSEDYRLSGVPEKLVIMPRIPRSALQPTQADFHYVPLAIKIRIGNKTGILNTFDQPALYQIIRRFIPISWQTFSGKANGTADQDGLVPTVSAPIVLDFARDIVLPAGMAPGVNTNFNIQVEEQIENQIIPTQDVTSDPVELVLDFITSGFMYNQNGTTQTFYDFMTESDVLNAKVDHSESELDPPIGGGLGKAKSLFKDLGSHASKLGKKGLKEVGKVAKSAGKELAHEGARRGIEEIMSNLR